MSVTESFDLSVRTAVSAGNLDDKAHGAAIQAARKLAVIMDEPGWPIYNGKLDNVSPGVFLKYCAALGLVPDEVPKSSREARKKMDEAKPKASSANVLYGTKFGKCADG